jgi:hypothetical protein
MAEAAPKVRYAKRRRNLKEHFARQRANKIRKQAQSKRDRYLTPAMPFHGIEGDLFVKGLRKDRIKRKNNTKRKRPVTGPWNRSDYGRMRDDANRLRKKQSK